MKYRQAAGVVKREIAGEIFLVPVKQKLADMQNLFVLHGCGEYVWDRLEKPADSREVAGCIAADYEVPLEQAARDAAAFIAELVDAGLVNPAG
jgi:hypothetical protein